MPPAFAFPNGAFKSVRGAAQRPSHCPVFGQLQLCARWRQPGAESPCRISHAARGTGADLFADGARTAFLPHRTVVSSAVVAIPFGGIRIALPYRTGQRDSPISTRTSSTSPAQILLPTAPSAGRAGVRHAIASIHTRFETYLAFYHLEVLEPAARAIMRRLYRRCDAIVAPAESTAAVLRAQRMNRDISIWSRGVDREQFNPRRRDMAWRRNLGIEDDALVVTFLGRLVIEKGLDQFADAIDLLAARNVKYRVLVIGEGPARQWFEQRLPAKFIGQQVGDDLPEALPAATCYSTRRSPRRSVTSPWKRWPARFRWWRPWRQEPQIWSEMGKRVFLSIRATSVLLPMALRPTPGTHNSAPGTARRG